LIYAYSAVNLKKRNW